MERDDMDLVEDLRIKVKELDSQIKEKEEELSELNSERARYLKEIGEHSDEKFQQDMLELVYEQRKKNKKQYQIKKLIEKNKKIKIWC